MSPPPLKTVNYRRLLGKVVALALIVILVGRTDFRQLYASLANLTFGSLSLLLILSVLLVYVSALKWSYFVDHFGQRISVIHLFNLYLVGYFINLVVPSYIGGDAVRSWYAGKRTGQHQAFASTILERYTGFVAMMALALFFVWFAPIVTLQVKLFVVLMAIGLAAISAIALSSKAISFARRLPKSAWWVGHLEKVQKALLSAKGQPALWIKALVLSFGFHTLTIINTLVAAHAVGWTEAPILDLFVVVPLILLIGAIPVTPGGLGIQEGAFYVFLHAIGASEAQALSVGLLLRAKSYLLALVGGAIWFFLRRAPTVKEGSSLPSQSL